jgi:predicted DNA-binding transcriptional regulator YafY
MQTDFKIEDYLEHAWGNWKSDESQVEIVFKFNAAVADRVLENSWHEDEKTELLADGSLLWKACIAQPHEMYPWIRGWGSDVEVLEPPELRTVMREEIEKMILWIYVPHIRGDEPPISIFYLILQSVINSDYCSFKNSHFG